MDQKNISPNPQQPVERQPAGKLPNLLAELEEASLNNTYALPSASGAVSGALICMCSYDGEDE